MASCMHCEHELLFNSKSEMKTTLLTNMQRNSKHEHPYIRNMDLFNSEKSNMDEMSQQSLLHGNLHFVLLSLCESSTSLTVFGDVGKCADDLY